jgi:hypothetical protein
VSLQTAARILLAWHVEGVMRFGRFLAISVMVLLPSGTAYADLITINAFDRGWYNDEGFHAPVIENYAAGRCVPCSLAASEIRNFFVFDLSGVSGPISSATLRLSTRGFSSADATEIYTVFDVSTLLASLAAGTGGVAAFNDLGSGVSYGSRIYSESDEGFIRDILLGGSAITALEAALGGTFGIGGALTSLSSRSDFEAVFGEAALDPGTVSLVLETGVRDVPEPASLLLFGTALACLAARRSRRQRV